MVTDDGMLRQETREGGSSDMNMTGPGPIVRLDAHTARGQVHEALFSARELLEHCERDGSLSGENVELLSSELDLAIGVMDDYEAKNLRFTSRFARRKSS